MFKTSFSKRFFSQKKKIEASVSRSHRKFLHEKAIKRLNFESEENVLGLKNPSSIIQAIDCNSLKAKNAQKGNPVSERVRKSSSKNINIMSARLKKENNKTTNGEVLFSARKPVKASHLAGNFGHRRIQSHLPNCTHSSKASKRNSRAQSNPRSSSKKGSSKSKYASNFGSINPNLVSASRQKNPFMTSKTKHKFGSHIKSASNSSFKNSQNKISTFKPRLDLSKQLQSKQQPKYQYFNGNRTSDSSMSSLNKASRLNSVNKKDIQQEVVQYSNYSA